MSEKADRLAKRLHPYLTKAGEAAGDFRWPGSAGWFDFISTDRPETTDDVEMAKAAFFYLAVDANGQWRKPLMALGGVLAFLREGHGVVITKWDLLRLKPLIEERVPNRQAVEAWFESLFDRKK